MQSDNSLACSIALTIAIPNYNYGDFLGKLLLMINACELREKIEVIVSDGGSTDASREVCIALLKPQDQLIYGPDKGQADAIDKALKVAQGQWFMFQNSDDMFELGELNRLVQLIESQIDSDVIAFDYGTMNPIEGGQDWYREIAFRHTSHIPTSQLAYNIYFTNQSTAYRTALAREIGFDNSYRFALDYDFVVRFFKRFQPKVHFEVGALGYQRMHGQSKTSKLSAICREETLAIRAKEFSVADRISGLFHYFWYHSVKYLFMK